MFGLGSALAGLGVLGIRSFETSLKSIILNDTRSLDIAEADVDRFIAEAKEEKFWQQFTFTKKGFLLAHTWLGSEYLPYRLKYVQYRSHVVGTFLLSTDYFQNKMQAGKPVQYLAFYNPYKSACASPFSNLYFPS